MGAKIAIVGTGAVGGYAGAHMAQAGEDVTFIDPWPEHVETMKAKGLKITAICPGFTKTEFGSVAGVQHIMDAEPRAFSQTAEEVVEIAIRANQRGKVVVVPGWHNKLAVGLMRGLPEPIVRAIIGAGSAKYHLGD